MIYRFLATFALVSLSLSAPSAMAGDLSSSPLKARTASDGETLFTPMATHSTGVDFVNAIVDGNTHPMRRLYASSMVVGGIAVGDVDGDGRPDLYFVNGPAKNRLFRQVADFKFKDITSKAHVDGGTAWGVGTAMVDIDNDGDLDIYVCNHGSQNQLYINDGDGVFAEQAKAFGLNVSEACHTPAFCDYDLDGNLDLFLLTNKFYHPKGKFPKGTPVATMARDGKTVVLKPEFQPYLKITSVDYRDGQAPIAHWEDYGRPDYLFRNNGNGTFSNVTRKVGISSEGWGLSATWWDYNDDGYPDLYVANDFNSPDYFYRNNGNGTFTNIIETMVPHTAWFSMGADFGDLNGDGRFDLLVADMSGSNHYKQKTAMGAMGDSAEFLATAFPRQYMRNVLYLGTGTSRFIESAYLAGLADTDWTWTVKLCDFDSDGRDDVYFSNGMSKNYNESDNKAVLEVKPGETQWDRHVRAGTPELREKNLAFHNRGDLVFDDVGNTWGLDHEGMSFGSVHTDLDRDGDLDLVVVNLEEPVSVYRNESVGANSVLISLKGTQSNLRGIGARVSVESGGVTQRRQLTTMRGYMASHEAILHYGLGAAKTVERVTIDWPSGQRQELTGLKVNQHHVIAEPQANKPTHPWAKPVSSPMFVATTGVQGFKHEENFYDDFRDQPLLPNKLSQNGPGLAVGDIDNDGDDDFVLGAAVNKTTVIGRQTSPGIFRSEILPDKHAAPEDMGVLLFEADGDGDLDLYVVSGGYEWKLGKESEPLLQDRIYKNDGKGNLKLDPRALPRAISSGGAVTAGDWDRDGDLDLFVGGRVLGGKYPSAPESFLLENEGGRFQHVANKVAPGLSDIGMVTSAIFTDVDDDGWSDLMVTLEWGAVRYFHNTQGRFIDRSKESGLSERTGWWNSITSADFDRDGDLDYIVGNYGLNTKYHANVKKPALIYYGDFDNTGVNRIIEAEFEDETLFPIRGRSCSTHAIPDLGKRFNSYHDFALAPLEKIYTPECLDDSQRFAATELESGILLNDQGRFTFKPLPRLVQTAPVFGICAQEIDGDGIPDLYLVQNSHAPQVETGHMAGGVSLLLQGNGDGTFEPVWPAESGLLVPHDAKGVAVTDWNGDAKPDFLVTRNNDTMLAFENRSSTGQFVKVRLKGNSKNPQSIGARVTLHTADGKQQTAEVLAGSGYLSQSTSALTFGKPAGAKVTAVTVRWPNGTSRAYTKDLGGSTITLKW